MAFLRTHTAPALICPLNVTRMLYGHAPDFHDEATWLISRSPELDANFRTREMHFMVFDDSAGEGSWCLVLSGSSRGVWQTQRGNVREQSHHSSLFLSLPILQLAWRSGAHTVCMNHNICSYLTHRRR